MTVEITIVIAAASLALGICTGLATMRRNNRQDDRGDASRMTTVIVKLENIESGIGEIKNDLRDVKVDIKDHADRLTKAEERIKTLNKTVFGGNKNEN